MGITGGLINMATGTRAGDTISLVIQLSPEVYGVVGLGKTAMSTYPGKAQALKAANALDDAAFKAGQIKERAPAGTEREALQTPELKTQIADEATRKAAAEAVEAEAKANETVVTGKRKVNPALERVRYTINDVPSDLIANDRGVYGYMPKEGTQFSKERWGVDWGNTLAVEKAQKKRISYHEKLSEQQSKINTQRVSGQSEEQIAKKLSKIVTKVGCHSTQ